MNAPTGYSGERALTREFWLCLALVGFMTLPLLWPTTPPLIDLPGHIGRYYVALNIDNNETLKQFYSYNWRIIGNLGFDLLIIPLNSIFGLELGVKILVICTQIILSIGILITSKYVHGKIQPGAIMALTLSYNYPFNYGFVNYSLSMALAILAYPFWIYLSQKKSQIYSIIIFSLISLIIWTVHVYGWAILSMTCTIYTIAKEIRTEESRYKLAKNIITKTAPFLSPIPIMIGWRFYGNSSSELILNFNLMEKLGYLININSDKWFHVDLIFLVVLILFLYFSIRSNKTNLDRPLSINASSMLIIFIASPQVIMGSYLADMRLAPYVFIYALLAIKIENPYQVLYKNLMSSSIFILIVRILFLSASYAMYENHKNKMLFGLNYIPYNSKLLSLYQINCVSTWENMRHSHIVSFALFRKNSFANDQWALTGGQLIEIAYKGAPYYDRDPYHLMTKDHCPNTSAIFLARDRLKNIPDQAFDWLWLPNLPRDQRKLSSVWVPVWQSDMGAVYRHRRTLAPHARDRLPASREP